MTKNGARRAKGKSTSETVCSFPPKGHGKKQTVRLPKTLCKEKKLCYPIQEAKGLFRLELTRPTPTRANGRNMLRKQGFNPRWREITQEELSANVYGGREIDLVGIFSAFLVNDYGLGNQFIEVVHGKAGKDFLVNELHLFCVEMLETDGVFQFTERSFNPPAHGIELFLFFRREVIGIQIGNDGFKGIVRNRKTHNAKRKLVEHGGIVLSGTGGEKIKFRTVRDMPVVVFVFQELLDLVGLLSGQIERN